MQHWSLDDRDSETKVHQKNCHSKSGFSIGGALTSTLPIKKSIHTPIGWITLLCQTFILTKTDATWQQDAPCLSYNSWMHKYSHPQDGNYSLESAWILPLPLCLCGHCNFFALRQWVKSCFHAQPQITGLRALPSLYFIPSGFTQTYVMVQVQW